MPAMGTVASHRAGTAVEECYPIICFLEAKPISSDYLPQPLNSDLNVPYVRFIGHRAAITRMSSTPPVPITAIALAGRSAAGAAMHPTGPAPPHGGTATRRPFSLVPPLSHARRTRPTP